VGIVTHDRIHARKPTHDRDRDRWSVGTIAEIDHRDGHCVVTVRTPDGSDVELVVTQAIRELFTRRLDITEGDSPVGEQVWYRKHGG